MEEEVEKEPNKEKIHLFENNDLKLGPKRATVGGTEDLIAFLRSPRKDGGERAQSIGILRNALRAVSGYFYPTEDITHTGPLGYYRQREWRIIANISKDGQELTRDLNEIEKERLKKLDPEFFTENLEFFTGTYPRIDQCQLFHRLDLKPIIQYVHRVIAPSDATAAVRRLLKTIEGAPKVVALEAL